MNELYFIPVIIIFLLSVCYFSAIETAISVSSKAKLTRFAKLGNQNAIIALQLQKQLGLVISVILACVVISSVVATTLATTLLNAFLGDYYGTLVSTTLMAALVWVFGEVLPKMYALHRAEALLLSSSKFLQFIFKLFSPFNRLVGLMVSFLLKICGVSTEKDAYADQLDELKGAIDLHTSPNQEDTKEEKAMLKSILDLGSVLINEIMVHRKNITMINADDSLKDIIEQALASPYTRIPLWQGSTENIVGVIHIKALLGIQGDLKTSPVRILDIADKPWFIPENIDLLEQLKLFREKRRHFAVVVDEYGALLGVVTLEDILEEIVGEITDEHDIAIQGARPQEDGSFIINGNVTLRDLNRKFDWELPDDEASTLAGLMIYAFRIIPTVGQIFMLGNFRFEIMRRQKNQITLIRVTPPQIAHIS
ncbi:MAG: hypothetical protein COY39_02965 [Alphaproteobacteria bacterium CG_4_10_14_0_8_um_filter_37_21]|nr:MAG: hypothetical protein COY39_02965 [Alphaproteobacteria bacterium CG_4_10_14_0_8_um_filter_37_21]